MTAVQQAKDENCIIEALGGFQYPGFSEGLKSMISVSFERPVLAFFFHWSC
jgi:hypothetical protein